MRLRIRTRLTLAYTSIVLLLMVALGLALYVALNSQLNKAADAELNSRADSITHFLQRMEMRYPKEQLARELREHSELNAKGVILQLSDASGTILYRSGESQNVPIVTDPGRPRSNLRVGRKRYRVLRRDVDLSEHYVIEVASDRSEYNEALEHLRTLLFLGIPLTLFLSFVAGLWMSGRVLRPIHRITDTVREIDGRRLAVRLPLSGSGSGAGDEIDDLSQTMNGMLDRLQHAFDRIGRFTADASHELRTPLALIRGNAEIMRLEDGISAETESRSLDILAEADRMQMLIQGLLELARNDEMIQPAFEQIDPADLTLRIAQVGRRLATEAGVNFVAESPRAIFPILGSDLALSRVGVILLDNAIRHTPAGNEVRLVVRSSPTEFVMEVCDTGDGIEAKHLPHIFDRFYRVDDSRNRATGGAGLGLSIAQSIVGSHGGTITVTSVKGHGATFMVTIPARPS